MAAAGVCYAALTDHDTTAGQERFRLELEKHGIQAITGAELEVQSPYGVQHLLAYGFDLENEAFSRTLHNLRNPLWYTVRHFLRRVFPSKPALRNATISTPDAAGQRSQAPSGGSRHMPEKPACSYTSSGWTRVTPVLPLPRRGRDWTGRE